MHARQIMKAQADKHRSDRQFAVGDWVFLKVQPYVQNSVADRASHKLAFRFFCPFQVEARVGEVSYKLRLPPKTLIYPVVHVSLLRSAHPPSQEEEVRFPPPLADTEHGRIQDEPFQVLQRRQYLRGAAVRTQALVHWSSMLESLATWEDEAQLRARFPHATAWGQAGPEGEGNVTTQSSIHRIPEEEATTEAKYEPEQVRGRPQRLRRPSARLDPAVWDLK
jgi:hypothetical protein